MPPYKNKITATLILLSLGVILFVGFFNYEQRSHNEHNFAGTTSCPFMQHEDSLCPMTVFDHLSTLRNIYEATILNTPLLKFSLGFVIVTSLYTLKPKWWSGLCLITFWRWRQKVKSKYFVRRHQELFANGLLNPKLFYFKF